MNIQTPSNVPEMENLHDVWVATRFSVRADSGGEAEARAAAWLAALLAGAASSEDQDITITRPAQNLQGVAVLALQLMAMEKKEGEILGQVHQLRARLEGGSDEQ